MKITIYTDSAGFPIVIVEGDDPTDTPKAVAEAYQEVQRILKEEKTK